MIWLSFDTWNSKHGYFLTQERIYREGKWTPFCHVEKRYDSWLGFWKKPESMCWLLAGHTITFAGIPSETQEQEAIDVAKAHGLVLTGQALAAGGMFELYLKEPEAPDWKISIPDGHAGTASVTYKGQEIKVISVNLHLRGGEAALLTLEVWPRHLEAIMGTLGIEIEVSSCK